MRNCRESDSQAVSTINTAKINREHNNNNRTEKNSNYIIVKHIKLHLNFNKTMKTAISVHRHYFDLDFFGIYILFLSIPLRKEKHTARTPLVWMFFCMNFFFSCCCAWFVQSCAILLLHLCFFRTTSNTIRFFSSIDFFFFFRFAVCFLFWLVCSCSVQPLHTACVCLWVRFGVVFVLM